MGIEMLTISAEEYFKRNKDKNPTNYESIDLCAYGYVTKTGARNALVSKAKAKDCEVIVSMKESSTFHHYTILFLTSRYIRYITHGIGLKLKNPA